MSVNNTWSSAGSTDGNLAGNWSLGHTPTTGEVAYYDNTSDVNCTFSHGLACDGVNVASGYDGTVDFGTSSWVLGSGGLVIASGGTHLLRTTRYAITGGPLTISSAVDADEATFQFGGTCTWNAPNRQLGTVTVVSGGTTTASSSNAVVVTKLEVNGSLVNNVTYNINCTANADVEINTGGSVSGTGTLGFIATASGHGLTVLDGTLDCLVQVNRPKAGSIWASGTYGGGLKIYSDTIWQDGTFTFDGTYSLASLEVETTATGADLTVDLSNNPIITITGALTFDIDSSGNITLSASQNGLGVRGDMVNEITGAGSLVANSQLLTFAGTANQNIDGCGGTWGVVGVDKPSGTLTLTGAFTCSNFNATKVDLDLNGQTLTATGAINLPSACTMHDPAGSTVNCGTIGANGVDMIGSATWYLNATTSGTLLNLTIANCDASGGVEIDATDNCVDGGGNVNVNFGVLLGPLIDGGLINAGPINDGLIQ